MFYCVGFIFGFLRCQTLTLGCGFSGNIVAVQSAFLPFRLPLPLCKPSLLSLRQDGLDGFSLSLFSSRGHFTFSLCFYFFFLASGLPFFLRKQSSSPWSPQLTQHSSRAPASSSWAHSLFAHALFRNVMYTLMSLRQSTV